MHGITGAQADQDAGVAIRFRIPAEPLRDLITSYMAVDVTGSPYASVEDLLHPEWGNLRLQMQGQWHALDDFGRPIEPQPAALFGPTSRARRIVAHAGAILGIGFTPLGWALLIGCRADETADKVLPAEQLLGPDILELHRQLLALAEPDRFALLDRFFLRRIERGSGREAVIRSIHAALLDPAVLTVEQFADRAGLSQATLGRACVRDFGFRPKLLLRRQRFLRTMAALSAREDEPIGELLDGAYTDHSHFNREFRRFMGLSPSAYLAEPRLMLRAAAGLREQALGASLQGLHALSGER